MKLLRTRTLTNEVDMHMNNANESAKPRTMVEDGDKHKNKANDVANNKNDAK